MTLCPNRGTQPLQIQVHITTSQARLATRPGRANPGSPTLPKQHNPSQHSDVLLACLSDLALNPRRKHRRNSKHLPSNNQQNKAGSRPLTRPARHKGAPTSDLDSSDTVSVRPLPPQVASNLKHRRDRQQHPPTWPSTLRRQHRHNQHYKAEVHKNSIRETRFTPKKHRPFTPRLNSTPRPAARPPRQRRIEHSVVYYRR